MATKKAAVVEKVAPKPAVEATPVVNPAIDPNLSAQERLDALTEQHKVMQGRPPDYPVPKAK